MKAVLNSLPKTKLKVIDSTIGENHEKQRAVLVKVKAAKKILSETSNLQILNLVH